MIAGFGWVLATIIAAATQTARNATQAGLTKTLGTLGATQVRFLFGLPFALLFLALVHLGTGDAIPAVTLPALGFTSLGAAAQIAATALMLATMQRRAFGITTAWLKTEPVMVAVIGAVVLGDHLPAAAWGAIALATFGVVFLSVKPGQSRQMLQESGPAMTGIFAGMLFGLAAIGFRGGILALPSGGFLIRASTNLALSLALQTTMLLIWLLIFDRAALIGGFRVWRRSLGAGFLGATASQFWFIGFALTSAANVRTLALIEVFFAQAWSYYLLRQATSARQIIGMAIICAGVIWLLQVQV